MAEVFTIKLAAIAAGDSAASADIPQDADIVGVSGYVGATGADADGDFVRAELSFLSTNQLLTNDARASIFQVEVMITSATVASIAKASEQQTIAIPDGIPVAAGERIHLHVTDAAGVSPVVVFMVYLKSRTAPRRRTRRTR